LNLVAKDKVNFAKSAKRVAAWDFTRIIPCHGDVLEANGKEAWNSANKNFL